MSYEKSSVLEEKEEWEVQLEKEILGLEKIKKGLSLSFKCENCQEHKYLNIGYGDFDVSQIMDKVEPLSRLCCDKVMEIEKRFFTNGCRIDLSCQSETSGHSLFQPIVSYGVNEIPIQDFYKHYKVHVTFLKKTTVQAGA
jgi:hypothetical protein